MRGKGNVHRLDGKRAGITPARAGKSSPGVIISASGRDHPRACGEKWLLCVPKESALGSPPRVRGKGERRCRRRWRAGITPARAGKRRLLPLDGLTERDHPRACGEKLFTTVKTDAGEGSPPRVRGKEAAGRAAGRSAGITPARAGKRYPRNTHRASARDHPRACGEKRSPCRFSDCFRGSPPRVRGKVQQ